MAQSTPKERFWACVDQRGPDECWPWTGRLDRDGYGTFKVDRRPKSAHRFAYELLVGPIPDALDHDCHTRDAGCPGGPTCLHRRCTNPAHLVPVSRAENAHRAKGRKSHCKNGHELTPENLRNRPDRTGRECLTCYREWRRRREIKE